VFACFVELLFDRVNYWKLFNQLLMVLMCIRVSR